MRARNRRRLNRPTPARRERSEMHSDTCRRGTSLRGGGWLLTAVLVTLLSLAAAFAPTVWAGPPQPDDPDSWGRIWRDQLAQGRIFNGDLTVEPGQVIESDVVLYDGNVEVREESRIAGNLVVYSGDILIEQGGVVEGDVSAFSGDVEIAGEVGGNVASWSGDIDLAESARVAGDVSVLSGDVDRDSAAFVGGNVVQGPDFRLGVPPLGMFRGDHAPEPPIFAMDHGGRPLGARVGAFFLRLLLGFGLALVLVPIAALVTYAFPNYIGDIEATYRRQPAAAFILGLMTGPVMAVIALVLAITICGLILVPVPFLALLGLSFVGWTALSLTTGRRVGGMLGMDAAPPVLVLVGGALLALFFVPLWSMGSCFRFFAVAGMFLLGAFGLGAAVMLLLERIGRARRNGPPPPALPEPARDPGSVPPAPPVSGVADARTATDITAYAPPPAPPAPESAAPPASHEDDFTRISGIGQVQDARLKVAGVRTFAQLAQLAPAEIGAIIGLTPERVAQARMAEQAGVLAGID